MRVTVKGQVTIPGHIRKKLGITASSEVIFVEKAGRVFLEKTSGKQREKSTFRKLRGVATVKMTTEEIMNLTRK